MREYIYIYIYIYQRERGGGGEREREREIKHLYVFTQSIHQRQDATQGQILSGNQLV